MNFTAETLAEARKMLNPGGLSASELYKTVTQGTGLTAYDLQAPAKNLYPTVTPLRNMIARKTRRPAGPATNWRVITSITGSGFDNMGWVPEGQRSARMSYQAVPKAANYVTIGEEDAITFEAESAAEGFEDVNATGSMRLLQKTMTKEEIGILGGNASISLGAPGAVASSSSGTGGTLPTLTYDVYVVPLTLEGFANSSLAGGVATQKTITGADGQTFVLNGGSGNKSTLVTQAVTLGGHLIASITPIVGAVGYAWFVGPSGGATLQAITTVAQLDFSTPIIGGRQAITAITADCSKNMLAFDGLLTQALTGGGYLKTFANGTKLTSTGTGGIAEIEDMFQNMWDTFRLSATEIWVSSQESKWISRGVLNGSSAPLLRYSAGSKDDAEFQITAGGRVNSYYNPFDVSGGTKIPIRVHPNLPPGTVLGWCSQLPAYYQSNETPAVAEMLTRRDYYRMDWPLRTRQREFGVYAEEVLAVYAPFAMAVMTNISPGLT